MPDYVPTDGLVAWYPFNGNANDESGNGNDGDVNGAILTEDEYGNSNSAYYFDGNDRIDIAHRNDFDWSAMTFMIVYKDYDNPNAVPNGNSILVSKQPGSGWGSGWGFSTGDENTEFGLCMTTTSGNDCWGWGENEWGDWNMVAYTHSPDSVKVYFNGSLVSEEVAFGGFIANSLPITIGMRGNGWNQFIGSISMIGMWDRILTEAEISALHNAELPAQGCSNSLACNFDPEANSDNGTCEFVSCHCLTGTVWDEELGGCIGDGSGDINNDGCVQLGDLLDLLSAYGDCGAGVSPWQCGDPLEHQGYDYATVLIGDQCWFAENLRSENYDNGDAIPAGLNDSEWTSTTSGATAVYGEGSGYCETFTPDGDACDEAWSLNEYGRLYNWYAVEDVRGLCPSGRHVPTDGEWMTMEMALGMSESEANSIGLRGTDQGTQMKTTYGWYGGGNGTNSSGFSSLPGGGRSDSSGNFGTAGANGYWWSSSPYASSAWYRDLGYDDEFVDRFDGSRRYGFSVRCVRDAE